MALLLLLLLRLFQPVLISILKYTGYLFPRSRIVADSTSGASSLPSRFIHYGSTKNKNSPVQRFVKNSRHESCSRTLKYLASFPNLVKPRMLAGLVISPEFFRCVIDNTSTLFPLLIEFELKFAPETAYGGWHFQRDDETLEKSQCETACRAF